MLHRVGSMLVPIVAGMIDEDTILCLLISVCYITLAIRFHAVSRHIERNLHVRL